MPWVRSLSLNDGSVKAGWWGNTEAMSCQSKQPRSTGSANESFAISVGCGSLAGVSERGAEGLADEGVFLDRELRAQGALRGGAPRGESLRGGDAHLEARVAEDRREGFQHGVVIDGGEGARRGADDVRVGVLDGDLEDGEAVGQGRAGCARGGVDRGDGDVGAVAARELDEPGHRAVRRERREGAGGARAHAHLPRLERALRPDGERAFRGVVDGPRAEAR